MPKVTTAYAGKDDMKFKYDISVDKEGRFTTTLPKDTVEKLQAANIDLDCNRSHNYGFFLAPTLNGLKEKVTHVVDEYFSRKLASRKIVIRYFIQTTCSYCLDKNGYVVPNGDEDWVGSKEHNWRTGTVDLDATHRHPYGILVYAEPFVREDYVYKSGKKKTEYIRLCYNGFGTDQKEKNRYLRWLDDLVTMAMPDAAQYSQEPNEIDYTEEAAAFFVNIITSICVLNEKIKDHIDPKSIMKMIEQKQHLLGGTTL